MPAMAWEGERYQQRFDALAAGGTDVHGEAQFVAALDPGSVLDAGCGSGRVAIELDRRGIEVVGADRDASMLEAARRRGPSITWVQSDVAALDLGRTFDVVVMAGNVPLFTPQGTQAALVAGAARHVAPGGLLVAGFQLGKGYELDEYDGHCGAAGLTLERRFATWGGDAFPGDGSYAVSVHHRAGAAGADAGSAGVDAG
jgi:SAM-dependent methyltransferase